ncbi:flagellin FliC3 [Lachnospiraceae bacterium OttesenSCG-928-D06]|nr:flagellin FliC3 [Lachnospiraceae bacterium OttesenSCG-928-D06]
MRVNYNTTAMLSNNALKDNDSALAKSLERLSSGLKINHAKDNPSGLAMANRMNAQIEGVSVANSNSGNGVSVIETADGALTEVTEMIQRISELSVKAATGTVTDEDRAIIQEEIAALKDEITRVSKSTQFNGQNLLDGTFERKGYTNSEGIKVSSYSNAVEAKLYELSITVADVLDTNGVPTGEKTVNAMTAGNGFPQGVDSYSVQDNILTIKGEGGFEIKLDITDAPANASGTNVELDITGIGAMRLQIGSNEGQILEVNIPNMSLRNMGIESVDVSTQEGALEAIDRAKGALNFVNDVRSKLGAYQNRLESTVDTLDITEENMTAAFSRIMDIDMAEEMTKYSTYQVLTQVGTSMLAQANERPSQVLQLLQ